MLYEQSVRGADVRVGATEQFRGLRGLLTLYTNYFSQVKVRLHSQDEKDRAWGGFKWEKRYTTDCNGKWVMNSTSYYRHRL